MLAVSALACVFTSSVASAAVKGIKSASTNPIAVRGGILMMQLEADRPGDQWPATLELKLEGGESISAAVAWISPRPAPPARSWTTDPGAIVAREIQPTDDTALAGSGSPFLFARLPLNGNGQIKLGSQKIHPIWLDRPAAMIPPLPPLDDEEPAAPQAAAQHVMPLVDSIDRPDPTSPLEYWRWVLLADRLEMLPPPTDSYGPFGSLVAEHTADLWRVALARVAGISRGVAEQCRNVLTRICTDRAQPFAAWAGDSTSVGRLLSTLLNPDLSNQAIIDAALAWSDAEDRLLIWPEAEYGSSVRLLVANPTDTDALLQIAWASPGSPGGAGDVPIAVTVPRSVLSQMAVDRPVVPPQPRAPRNIGAETKDLLTISTRAWQQRLIFGPGVYVAQPPGVFFASLNPPLTLPEIRAQHRATIPSGRATYVSVRRLGRRWEIFIDCRRPQPPAADVAGADSDESPIGVSAFGVASVAPAQGVSDPANPLAAFTDVRNLRSVEAVTIFVGPEAAAGGPVAVLSVPETGFIRMFRGENDGTLQYHRRSYVDRWLCRIVLPDSWLTPSSQTPLLLGFMRTHGDSPAVETGPGASVPWRPGPARAAIDISQWDDIEE